MGRVDFLTRDEVHELVKEAKRRDKDKKTHVRQKLLEKYPDLENMTVVRNGHVYGALEYLDEDLESYGEVEEI